MYCHSPPYLSPTWKKFRLIGAQQGSEFSLYNASKAAVLQLGKNLAMEWGPHNIRVNTISPGYIVTAMVEELFKKRPDRKEQWPKENMLGRLSRPDEYRGAAVFLISDASSFMTGADLRSKNPPLAVSTGTKWCLFFLEPPSILQTIF